MFMVSSDTAIPFGTPNFVEISWKCARRTQIQKHAN